AEPWSSLCICRKKYTERGRIRARDTSGSAVHIRVNMVNMNVGGSTTRRYDNRKRASTAADTGRRILEVTRDLFTERPLSEITLIAVADRAGVTVQTVIRRFGDRSGLIDATVEHTAAQVMAHRDAAPAGKVPAATAPLREHYETTGA